MKGSDSFWIIFCPRGGCGVGVEAPAWCRMGCGLQRGEGGRSGLASRPGSREKVQWWFHRHVGPQRSLPLLARTSRFAGSTRQRDGTRFSYLITTLLLCHSHMSFLNNKYGHLKKWCPQSLVQILPFITSPLWSPPLYIKNHHPNYTSFYGGNHWKVDNLPDIEEPPAPILRISDLKFLLNVLKLEI